MDFSTCLYQTLIFVEIAPAVWLLWELKVAIDLQIKGKFKSMHLLLSNMHFLLSNSKYFDKRFTETFLK